MHSFHVRVLSTPKGIMADKDAIKENVGGEVLFICN
jgi:ribosomal protein S8